MILVIGWVYVDVAQGVSCTCKMCNKKIEVE